MARGLSPRFLFGAVAQLEERHNGIVEVVGSIPIGSTITSPLLPQRFQRETEITESLADRAASLKTLGTADYR